MSYSSTDVKGVLRGRCIQCNNCQSYSSCNGLLCAKCRHPPTKHEKIGTGSSSVTAVSTEVRTAFSSGASGDITGGDYGIFGSYHEVRVPECKAQGCSKPVFYQEGFGYFDYCSPKCRDEHLLPTYNQQLDADIKNYQIQSTVAVDRSESVRSTSAGSKRTVHVEIAPKARLGLVLLKDGPEIVVAGAYTRTSLMWLRECKIYLLDTLVSVNGKSYSEPEQITEYCNPRTQLGLVLDQQRALWKDTTLFFEIIKKKEIDKVFCLKHTDSDYGFSIDCCFVVSNVREGSEAKKCGLQKGDKVVIYASASNNRLHEVIDKPMFHKYKEDITSAYINRHFLVIGIHSKM